MRNRAAYVVSLLLATGAPAVSAEAEGPRSPQRTLIVADDASIPFCLTPRTRDLMWRALRVLEPFGGLVGMVSTGRSGIAIPFGVDWRRVDSAVNNVMGEVLVAGGKGQDTSTSEATVDIWRGRADTVFPVGQGPPIPSETPTSRVLVLYFTDGRTSSLAQTAELMDRASSVGSTVLTVNASEFEDSRCVSMPDRESTSGRHRSQAIQPQGSVSERDLESILLSHVRGKSAQAQ
jgi:hypothetical protein